ncbi:hypothetical protein B0H11DRAFT_1969763 [Mycena galericulata]|nr:hypothetical protein B0H11DRAFT_1969763 [Mycena galericulata]
MKPWEIDNNFPMEPDAPPEVPTDADTDAEEDMPLPDAEKENDTESSDDGKDTCIWKWRRKPRAIPDPMSMRVFERALHLFDFKGVFMRTKRYAMSRAANPCLEIEGIGPVGLPLSERVAHALMADASSGRLEIPAEKIRFQNPDWDAWLAKEAESICTGLSGKEVQPSCRLRSLVLESPGSESTSPVPPADAIATLTFVLPSLFAGGQIQFSHGVQSKTIDFASDSQILTSAIAAYSVVKTVHGAITSGYRLSLTYDILQPDADPQSIPSFPDLEAATVALRQAMVEWKAGENESDDEFVAYFLQRQYSREGFNLNALAGSDSVLVAHLIRLAAELDFQLYVVHLQLYQSAYGEYEEWEYHGRQDKVDPRKITKAEVEDELTELDVVAFDVQGTPVEISGFDFRWDDYLNGEIRDVEPSMRDYDLFSDEKIRVDERYVRALFFLWPTRDDSKDPLTIRYSRKYACAALQASDSDEPSARENILVDSIRAEWERIYGKPKEPEVEEAEGARALCKCAIQWNDLEMFLAELETLRVATNLGGIGIDNCIVAYRKFGWDALKDFFEEAVRKDGSNPRRQEFLVELGRAAGGTNAAEVEAWCKEQQEVVLRSLNRVDISEVEWLLDLSTSYGVDFITETVYPQLEAQKLESSFWVRFTQRLVAHPAAAALGENFTEKCVQQAVDNLLAFPTVPEEDKYDRVKHKPAATLIMDVLKLCMETRNGDLCAAVLDKMKDAARTGAFSLECPPWRHYLELTRALDAYLLSLNKSDHIVFQSFFMEAAVWILAGSPKHGQPAFSPCPFTKDNLATFAIAIRRGGDLSFLNESNKKTVLGGRNSDSLITLVRHRSADFKSGGSPTEFDDDLTSLLTTVVRQAIDVFDMKSFHVSQSKGDTSLSPTVHDMVDMVKFCLEVGAKSELTYLLVHFATPPAEISIAKHVSEVLAPFLPPLREYLPSQTLDFEGNPFKYFAVNIVKAFGNEVMSQTPQDLITVAEIGCSECGDCRILRDFFAGDDQSISLPRAAKLRDHIKKQLEVPESWGVTVELDKAHGSPHRLEITKPDNLTIAGLRAENIRRGKALLALFGDEPAQRRILGSDSYENVVAQICGGKTSGGVKRMAEDDQMDTPTKKARGSQS